MSRYKESDFISTWFDLFPQLYLDSFAKIISSSLFVNDKLVFTLKNGISENFDFPENTGDMVRVSNLVNLPRCDIIVTGQLNI